MTDLIFLDTETTGLDDTKHEVWEVAYAINSGPIIVHTVPHSLLSSDPKALEMNGYHQRGGYLSEPNIDLTIREMLKGNTLVCSNPPFDRGFLKARWHDEPWHHRSVDISSYAMPVLGHDRPMGLKKVAEDLRAMGNEIPFPDHSAAGDVDTLRTCYWTLQGLAKQFFKVYFGGVQ